MIEQIMLSEAQSLLNFPVIRIDLWTIIISLGNLLILFLLVKKFLFKPVQKIFDQRKAQVDEVYKEANDARTAAEADKKHYEERLSHAETEADAIVTTESIVKLPPVISHAILKSGTPKPTLRVVRVV